MDVFIHESAEKFLNKLDKKAQDNIKESLKKLSINPYSKNLDIKKLRGIKNRPDLFRLRAGDYRAIYFIQEGEIRITEIMQRERGYDF
jgi:mRNA interferase RelE/StbE